MGPIQPTLLYKHAIPGVEPLINVPKTTKKQKALIAALMAALASGISPTASFGVYSGIAGKGIKKSRKIQKAKRKAIQRTMSKLSHRGMPG